MRLEEEENLSLQIIYGTAGTGKSSYIFEQIQENIKQKSNHAIKLITPEQFSFTAEKKLLETSSTSSILQAEVITFARMAYRVLNEVGGIAKQRLNSSGRAMLIDHILLTKKNDFSFLGKSDENVEMIARQLTELKKHQITLEQLQDITKEEQDSYLQRKLQDITTLYENYANQIQTKYIDENDGLTMLSQKLEESSQFRNCDIYIDEFAGFTLQEYEILRKLLKISHKVTITICADNLNKNTNPDQDLFYMNKQTANRVLEIAKQENIEVEEPIWLSQQILNNDLSNNNQRLIQNEKTTKIVQNKIEQTQTIQTEQNQIKTAKRFKTKELQHLAIQMASPFYEKYESEPKNIELFLANNPYSEIEHVAIEITKLAKQGYRYEEMAVITKNIAQYASLCKAIFAQYEIPVFIDEKKDLSNNVLVKFILSLLEIFSKNWSYEAVFGYLKTGLTSLEEEDLATLENYCIKWGMKGNKWYAKDWNFYEENEEEIEKIQYCKKQVVEPLLAFKNALQGTKTVKDITKAIYHFFIQNETLQKLEKKIETLKQDGELEIAKEYETSLQIVMDLLDEIVLVLGDENITFERYSKILKMGFTQSNLGTIPATADQVIVGDIDRSRSHKVKIAFLIGLNDGSFPSTQKDEGFLDDADRNYLKTKGIELAKNSIEQLYDENFNIYKAFTTAEEKLYLSYLSSDAEGKSLRPSILIHKIKRMFPNLKEQSDVVERKSEILLKNTTFDELLIQLRNFQMGITISPIWFQVYKYYSNHEPEKLKNALKALQYENTPEPLEPEKLQKLYGNTLKTSVSRLEKYQSCAFSYYLKYGLKLKEANDFKVQSIDTGNFMHEVIDSFFEYLEEENLNVKKITTEQVQTITQQIVEEKLTLKKYDIFNSVPKYRILAQRLKKVIVKSMQYIVESIQKSEFEVLGHEMEFKEGKDYPPIVFELQDGKKVEITGKIDRMDIAKTPDGNYIRIIDYKSSIKNINLNEVLAGLQLQLLTYLDAACKKEDVLPAGVFYFNLIDPIINGSQTMSEEEIEAELRKQFKMQGLILADSKIVRKMDIRLTSGASDIVPAYINKEGEVSKRANVLNQKQFENLQRYMEKIIKQISEEILHGNIAIEPYYQLQNKKTPCEYCEYKAICQFNQTTKNHYRYITNQEVNIEA